jgi:hypothetical protein
MTTVSHAQEASHTKSRFITSIVWLTRFEFFRVIFVCRFDLFATEGRQVTTTNTCRLTSSSQSGHSQVSWAHSREAQWSQVMVKVLQWSLRGPSCLLILNQFCLLLDECHFKIMYTTVFTFN